jgi:hypothetical protein
MNATLTKEQIALLKKYNQQWQQAQVDAAKVYQTLNDIIVAIGGEGAGLKFKDGEPILTLPEKKGKG